jgi:hypothetical protein
MHYIHGMQLVIYKGHTINNVLLVRQLRTKKEQLPRAENQMIGNLVSSINTLSTHKDHLQERLLTQKSVIVPDNCEDQAVQEKIILRRDYIKDLEISLQCTNEVTYKLERIKAELNEKLVVYKCKSVMAGTLIGATVAGVTVYKPFLAGIVTGGGVTSLGAFILV